MRLGEHTVGLRRRTPRVDGAGAPVLDEYGDQIVDVVDRKIPYSLVSPSRRRTADNREPEDYTAPVIVGTTWLAPAGTQVGFDDVVVWPIVTETGSEDTGDLALSGPTWEVVGEPGIWDEAVEVQLRRSTT